MEIKLVALDMDGTLLDSQKRLPPDFMDWVRAHPQVKVAIASGRPYYTIVRDFVPIKDKLIYVAENGGLVFENDAILYSNAIKNEDIAECLKRVEGIEGLTPIACGANCAYMERAKEVHPEIKIYYIQLQQVENLYEAVRSDTIVKIAIFVDEKKAEKAMRYFKNLPKNVEASLSGDSWIDLSYCTVSKGTGVRAIQEKYGIKKEESMAFGDYLNDASFFECCAESYCMENGHEDLKKLAKHIADSNDRDGVMKVLRTL